jgi:hypothetical protein
MRRFLLALVLSVFTHQANASAIITIVESGGNVVTSGAGTLDLTGLEFRSVVEGSGGFINGSIGIVRTGDRGDVFGPDPVSWDTYTGITGPSSFGSGGPEGSSVGNGTGDSFGVYGGNLVDPYIYAPEGYVSGSALSGSMTYFGETFASLGLTEGTYVWVLPNDTLTLNIVPIPTAVWLFGSGLGLLGWIRRRKTV